MILCKMMTKILCGNFEKTFLKCEKMASRKVFQHLLRTNFFMFILLISNHTVFLIQFGINLHLWVFQNAEIALAEANCGRFANESFHQRLVRQRLRSIRQRPKGWFPYDRRRSRIADRRSQKVLRSSAIIWKHTSAIVCDPAIMIADDRRRSQKIEPCSIFCDPLRSSAINCDRAIIWKPKFCDLRSKRIP